MNVISREQACLCPLVCTLCKNLRLVTEQCHVSPNTSSMKQVDDELIYNLILGVDLGKKEINNYGFIQWISRCRHGTKVL